MKHLWKVIVIAIIIVLSVSLIQDLKQARLTDTNGVNTFETEVIKIGFLGSLSGSSSVIGKSALTAAQLAVDEINEKGGIKGKALKLVAGDGRCDARDALQAGERLVDAGVVGIVGGQCSSETTSLIELLNKKEATIPILSYCSSAPSLSGSSDYFFRAFPSDTVQSEFAATYIREELGKQKVAVLNVDDEWGYGLQESFTKHFEKDGATVDIIQTLKSDQKDFSHIISLIEQREVELIYFVGFDKITIPFVKQIHEKGLDVPVFGTDAWDNKEIWEELGDLAHGYRYTAPLGLKSSEFNEKLKERGVYNPSLCVAVAYDAVNIFAQILQEHGEVSDANNLRELLGSINYKEGVSFETISFDPRGDLINSNYEVKLIKTEENNA